MSDILVGQSYYLAFDPKLHKAMEPYPPLGSLVAAACLERTGLEVAFFDAMLASSETQFDTALEHHKPRLAVLFEDNFNYLSKMCLSRMRRAAMQMIAMAVRRRVPVIVCGSDASDNPGIYLDGGATFVVVGEGESTLEALVSRYFEAGNGKGFDDIAGFVMAGDGPEPLRTGPRPVLTELDSLPPPAWDLIDMNRYRELWLARHGYWSINMATTRGCPFHCNWCAKPIWGQTYHMHSPGRIAGDLAWLKERYRPDHVWFCDDIMGLKRGWMGRFSRELDRLGARMPFKALSRADLLLRDGEVEALAEAGAVEIWIGAESGSQKVLDAMDKGTTVEQIRAATGRLRAVGIRVGLFLQFGYPGETREDIELTRQMVRSLRPDRIGMSVSYPLPGTRFHDAVQRQLGNKRNWTDSADLAMIYRGAYSTRYYRQLCRVVAREFRSGPAADSNPVPVSGTPAQRRGPAGRLVRRGLNRLLLPLDQLWLSVLGSVTARQTATRSAGWPDPRGRNDPLR